jgi:hypothetical protein
MWCNFVTQNGSVPSWCTAWPCGVWCLFENEPERDRWRMQAAALTTVKESTLLTRKTTSTSCVCVTVCGLFFSDNRSTARRDKLIELQKAAQKRWDEEKCFEQDAPAPGAADEGQDKHFVTFPYPYMNGMLHLGHTFSLSKTEFSMGT